YDCVVVSYQDSVRFCGRVRAFMVHRFSLGDKKLKLKAVCENSSGWGQQAKGFANEGVSKGHHLGPSFSSSSHGSTTRIVVPIPWAAYPGAPSIWKSPLSYLTRSRIPEASDS
ncbi:MAG: hypothetical protein WB630_22150, partial [Candidatus Acidiferrales bacterium]